MSRELHDAAAGLVLAPLALCAESSAANLGCCPLPVVGSFASTALVGANPKALHTEDGEAHSSAYSNLQMACPVSMKWKQQTAL
jgi:hypothetical protein